MNPSTVKNYLFIINPVSGKGRGKILFREIENYLQSHNISHEIRLTESPKHATEIVKQLEGRYEYIISVGGDGTLNEIVNGISKYSDTILGVLPVGSGNDFALNLGLDKNLLTNLDILCKETKQTKICDICELEYYDKQNNQSITKKFINSLGIGFDAQVAFINQHKKIMSGITSYIFAVLRALFNYKPIKYTLKSNDIEIAGDKLLLTFGNGVSSGGGFYLTPNAKIDDDLFDITTIEFISRFTLLQKLPMALINKMERVKEASMYKANNAEIKINSSVYIHTDGEADLISTDNIKVRILDKKIKFITNL